MIQNRTILKVADNSGAKMLQCVQILKGTRHRYITIGDIFVGVVKKAEPRKTVKKHEVVRAVVVRQNKEYSREDGTYIRFDDNACVVLEGKSKEPKGGRIFGPIPREIKEKGFDKIAALAPEII
jgi:large subunit ribosomal protein L14